MIENFLNLYRCWINGSLWIYKGPILAILLVCMCDLIRKNSKTLGMKGATRVSSRLARFFLRFDSCSWHLFLGLEIFLWSYLKTYVFLITAPLVRLADISVPWYQSIKHDNVWGLGPLWVLFLTGSWRVLTIHATWHVLIISLDSWIQYRQYYNCTFMPCR